MGRSTYGNSDLRQSQTGNDGNAWLPGKKYVYMIVFGDNEIRIAPTVTEWKDEPNVNIEVQ
jgi:hypothetical protein